jgi:putative membrane protein
MINYKSTVWFKEVFKFHRSDTIIILWKELILIGLFTAGITWVEIEYFPKSKVLENLGVVYSLIGFVLSLLLVFRTNTAYDRWWEGRKKWGEMVNNSRNLAIKISSMLTDESDREFFARMIPNYAFAMKEHLRDGVILSELELENADLEAIKNLDHKPSYIALKMYKKLHEIKTEGKISDIEFLSLDENLRAFSDIIGACERIKKTPIPYSYALFLKKFIFVYVTTLPLAFVTSLGYWTCAIAIFVFYVLVSIEVLAEEIEDPFGTDANDLNTDALSATIRGNVKEILA